MSRATAAISSSVFSSGVAAMSVDDAVVGVLGEQFKRDLVEGAA